MNPSDPSGEPTNETYGVRLSKQAFIFSAAHFITYSGDVCERLHGHNYHVSTEWTGPLDENSYVLDFIATRDRVAEITSQLDHRMLLPTRHPRIRVEETADREVVATFGDRRWVFPRDDCKLLDVANTTAELLARWIAERLMASLAERGAARPSGIRVEVEETDGEVGFFQI